MKKLNLLAALMCSIVLGSFSAHAASDRCAGKVSTSLLQSEAVSNFYFDMKLHEMICTYVLSGADLDAIEADVLVARTQIKPTLIKSQDHMVARLGSEGAFENFYAAMGNHISYLNLPDPCGRAKELATMMTASHATSKARIAKYYKPYFESLRDQYEAKSGTPMLRICDKARP